MAALDGSAVFGFAVSITEKPMPNQQQINNYFGVNGQQSLFGGTRGRTFTCTGMLVASSTAGIELAKQELQSFADGLTHTLTDNYNNSFPNVVMTNDFDWTGEPKPVIGAGIGHGMFGRPYRLTLTGMS